MGKIKVLTGNYTATEAAALCRPDLIAAYPITPQSSVVEGLAAKVHNGELDANMVQVESEHSAMSVVQGAAAGGGRVFTATSAQGLALMYEPYFRMSTLRMPMVMALATREMTSPETVWSGQQDAISVRDAGWIQVFCDSNQEIMDMIIQGYKLAEHPDVLIPVNVCYDGFYSSHLTEGVDVPEQKEVDEFLPAPSFSHCVLDPKKPFALDPLTPGPLLMKYRKNHLDAMEKALEVIEEIDQEFGKKFGRSYGGAVSSYRAEDAEVVLVTIGGMTGTGMDAVDIAREKGIKAGLVKLRFIRPFPAKRIAKLLEGKKAFAVVDRSVCFGWSQGPMHMEVKAALADVDEKYAHFSAIGGLGGADISLQNLLETVELLDAVKDVPGEKATKWFMNE
ncbi:phenylglyoxylate dehydrogenase [Anaerotignum lactatifermentans]|uniref:Phenylglyoxylate dehydrogenase n=1 Tax=Anaerotignum lactatifermentans TaxID=160404 RepID=A0ABS2GBJ3_9FIRM|nr:transketolase C-terminal domain-containing protein [Anaerotignum lactatifermentans]MBM6830255.1 phenylglyoxylate dehydrogenase [Anaerotignum lactatifermentans]MBM6878821.1 phenylglyoxylate dehydrogenase [Anaerotignum lactatifermentans]MBM6951868.1 phenylglyoxylate dehydrogenase [Anaerotignum lactatifermentans]